jgi:hypothetical protein
MLPFQTPELQMNDTQDGELSFVIPTHRLRDVGTTLQEYDEHFWRNGHSVRFRIFDDSSPVNQQKYYPLLEQTWHSFRSARQPARIMDTSRRFRRAQR